MNSSESDRTVHERGSGFRLWVAAGYSDRVSAEGLTDARGYEEAIAAARRVPGGRGPNWILDSLEREESIRIRPNRHGGLLGSLLGDRFLSPARAYREFVTWTELSERGIPMPVPVLAVSRRLGFFWRSALASVEREGARNGIQWLGDDPPESELRAMCIRFATTLRQFHDAGAVHRDLHVGNILVEIADRRDWNGRVEPIRCLLIDLDRTRIGQDISPRLRIRELLRFARSLEKIGRRELTSKRYRALVLGTYCAGDRRLRRSILYWAGLESLEVGRHRISWRIDRFASRMSTMTSVMLRRR